MRARNGFTRSPRLWVAAMLLAAQLTPAAALEVIGLDAAYRDDGFHVDFVAMLDAPVAAVERVLHDYAAYPQLDPRITEAQVLERAGPSELLLATRLRACAGIFCRSVRRIERVEERGHELIAHTLADRSDLRDGFAHTILTPSYERTRVTYQAQIEPAFWVPRFLAAGLALRTLETATVTLFENVERRAAAVAAA
jgi:hypothetical protein